MGRSGDESNRGMLFGASLELGGVTEAYLLKLVVKSEMRLWLTKRISALIDCLATDAKLWYLASLACWTIIVGIPTSEHHFFA